MDTIQRQSTDQNLWKFAEAAGFLDIYTQDYSWYFKDIKDYIYLNGKKYRPQDVSLINIFSFVTLKNEILVFLGWPYYILERLTILYAMFNFIGFLFSLLKGIYNTCAIHKQVNRQASVARILFAGLFGIFSSSINKILLDAQIKDYNTKISTKPNTYDESQNNTNILPTAPQLPNLHHNHPLSLVSRNFRNLAIPNPTNIRPSNIQSPIRQIVTQHSQNDDTYEQIIEQPHTTTFQSQNSHFFGPRWAYKLDHSTVPTPTLPISKTQSLLSHFLSFRHLIHLKLTLHPAWILILTQMSQFFKPYHNLQIPTDKPPMNLPTSNHRLLQIPKPALLHFPNLPFDLFNLKHIPYHPVLLPTFPK